VTDGRAEPEQPAAPAEPDPVEEPDGSTVGGSEPAAAPSPLTVGGPPGSRTFSIEGRPAPGLYVAGWLLGLLGGLLVVLAIFGAQGAAAELFLGIGLLFLVLAFAAASGYQILARAGRDSAAYRGPAPLLVLGFVIALGTLVELVIGITGVLDDRPTATFTLAVLIPLGCYLVAIQAFAVRGGGLAWATIVRLRPGPAIKRLGDWTVGAAAGIALVVPVLVGAAVLTSILGTTPNSALPDLTGGVDALVIGLGAVCVAPLGEELFFRGFAFSAWRADLGVASAVRRSAVVFAAVHILNVEVGAAQSLASIGAQLLVQFLVILPAGLLLAFMYERRGLAASLGTHMAYNGGLLFLAAAAARAVQGS